MKILWAKLEYKNNDASDGSLYQGPGPAFMLFRQAQIAGTGQKNASDQVMLQGPPWRDAQLSYELHL